MAPSVIIATAELAFVIALKPATTVLAAINPANPNAIRKMDWVRMMLSTALLGLCFCFEAIEVRGFFKLPDDPVYYFWASHA